MDYPTALLLILLAVISIIAVVITAELAITKYEGRLRKRLIETYGSQSFFYIGMFIYIVVFNERIFPPTIAVFLVLSFPKCLAMIRLYLYLRKSRLNK